MAEPICVLEGRDRLGEGPCWDPSAGRLYWFDIKGRRLRWHSPGDGSFGLWDLPFRASAGAWRAAGGLLLATEAGLAVADPDTRGVEIRQPQAWPPGFRSNDGSMDVSGAFWWSIMDDNGGKRPGVVFRTTADWRTVSMIEGVHIANALCASPDGRTLYQADSAAKTIFAFDHDPVAGTLSRRREFADTRGEAGAPDGAAVDAEGFVWAAQWGAWRVARYAPDGRLDRVVQVPVAQPSSCTFGGPDLATLYITSAWDGLSPAAREAQPLAGGLFAFSPGVRGLELPPFGG